MCADMMRLAMETVVLSILILLFSTVDNATLCSKPVAAEEERTDKDDDMQSQPPPKQRRFIGRFATFQTMLAGD